MNRVLTWVGVAAAWLVDIEAWSKVSTLLRRAAIIGALVSVGAILFYKMKFSTWPWERFGAAFLLIVVLPFAAYSVIKRLGEGEFFPGLTRSLISFGLAAALIAAIIELSIPVEFEQWASWMASTRPELSRMAARARGY